MLDNQEYRLYHFFVTLPAILILIATFFMYRNIQKTTNNPDKRGLGILWLILSITIWIFLSLFKYFGKIENGAILGIFLSISNSILLLAAFPCFKYRFDFFEKKENITNWYFFIAAIAVIFIILSIAINPEIDKNQNLPNPEQWKGSILDFALTFMTLFFLGVLLYKNFSKREMIFLGVLSWVTIGIQIGSQIAIFCSLVYPQTKILVDKYYHHSYVGSFVGMATIFVALAFSSIVEEIKETNKENIDKIKSKAKEEIQKVKEDFLPKAGGKYLRDKLANFEIGEVLRILLEYSEDKKQNEIHRELTNLSSQFTQLKSVLRTNRLTYKEAGPEYSRITDALVQIIDILFSKI